MVLANDTIKAGKKMDSCRKRQCEEIGVLNRAVNIFGF